MFPLHDPLTDDAREALAAYDDLTASLLFRRGITTKEDAEAFLSPSYDAHIGDPLLMKDMEKAARRLAKAIETKERIAVWSDYDCDGIPGGVVLHDFLKKAEANFTNYIPHRHEEGYGVNPKGLDTLHADGVTLVITVDSGITDIEAIAHANRLGMEVIVTDHHLPGDVLPEAFAVVDPKRSDETYPYREFCGGGLAWKLVCATLAVGFEGREKIPTGWEKWLLDMAGLSTIADMVPLTGENRVIARYGLLVMRKSPRIGLARLCKVARVDQRAMSEGDVGFMIAPRVNAASRMGDAYDAFRLFTTDDEAEADLLSKKLEALNRSRRATAGAITRTVHERIEKRKEEGELPDVIVMGDPDWRPGLLGLVANGISEEFERPVYLWGREGNTILKGSCRSGPGNVHVLNLMEAAVPGTFTQFGGHAASGGFTPEPDAIFDLEKRLNDAFKKMPKSEDGDELSRADVHITPKEATARLLLSLEKFAPFGMGNPKPTFAIHDVLLQEVSWFGKVGEHLRVRVAQDEFDPGTLIEGIAFFAKRELGPVSTTLKAGNRATLLCNIERDQFTRRASIRLRLIAIR